MSDTIIAVENLGKRYRLRHEGKAGYSTLRDALASRARRLMTGRTTAGLTSASEEEFWALKDVSFAVSRGDVVGIIGRNGAGKSTLLKILSRITEPTTGRVRLKGRVASLLEVGTGFHPELTGRENIFLNGAILGMSKSEIRAKFDEIVDFAEVEQFLDTPVKHYSSGMYVRLAFSVAAHLEPEILIVDEVLAVGDAQFQKKCLGRMKDVACGGRTVLFVSHNMATISALTDRLVVLERGSVRFVGNTMDGISLYLDSSDGPKGRYLSAKQGSSKPYVSTISLKTEGSQCSHISGHPLEIAFEIAHPTPISNGCFSFQIINQSQQPVLHCSLYATDESYRDLFQSKGRTILTCSFPRLALNVGSYTLNTYLTEPPGGAVFETLEGVCPFDVEILGKSTLWGWRSDACSYHETHDWKIQ